MSQDITVPRRSEERRRVPSFTQFLTATRPSGHLTPMVEDPVIPNSVVAPVQGAECPVPDVPDVVPNLSDAVTSEISRSLRNGSDHQATESTNDDVEEFNSSVKLRKADAGTDENSNPISHLCSEFSAEPEISIEATEDELAEEYVLSIRVESVEGLAQIESDDADAENCLLDLCADEVEDAVESAVPSFSLGDREEPLGTTTKPEVHTELDQPNGGVVSDEDLEAENMLLGMCVPEDESVNVSVRPAVLGQDVNDRGTFSGNTHDDQHEYPELDECLAESFLLEFSRDSEGEPAEKQPVDEQAVEDNAVDEVVTEEAVADGAVNHGAFDKGVADGDAADERAFGEKGVDDERLEEKTVEPCNNDPVDHEQSPKPRDSIELDIDSIESDRGRQEEAGSRHDRHDEPDIRNDGSFEEYVVLDSFPPESSQNPCDDAQADGLLAVSSSALDTEEFVDDEAENPELPMVSTPGATEKPSLLPSDLSDVSDSSLPGSTIRRTSRNKEMNPKLEEERTPVVKLTKLLEDGEDSEHNQRTSTEKAAEKAETVAPKESDSSDDCIVIRAQQTGEFLKKLGQKARNTTHLSFSAQPVVLLSTDRGAAGDMVKLESAAEKSKPIIAVPQAVIPVVQLERSNLDDVSSPDTGKTSTRLLRGPNSKSNSVSSDHIKKAEPVKAGGCKYCAKCGKYKRREAEKQTPGKVEIITLDDSVADSGILRTADRRPKVLLERATENSSLSPKDSTHITRSNASRSRKTVEVSSRRPSDPDEPGPSRGSSDYMTSLVNLSDSDDDSNDIPEYTSSSKSVSSVPRIETIIGASSKGSRKESEVIDLNAAEAAIKYRADSSAMDLETAFFNARSPVINLKRLDLTAQDEHTIRSLMIASNQTPVQPSTTPKPKEKFQFLKRKRMSSSEDDDSEPQSDSLLPSRHPQSSHKSAGKGSSGGSSARTRVITRKQDTDSSEDEDTRRLMRFPSGSRYRKVRKDPDETSGVYSARRSQQPASSDSELESVPIPKSSKKRKSNAVLDDSEDEIPTTSKPSKSESSSSESSYNSEDFLPPPEADLAFNDASSTDDDCVLLDDEVANPVAEIRKIKKKRLSQVPLLSQQAEQSGSRDGGIKQSSSPQFVFKKRDSLLKSWLPSERLRQSTILIPSQWKKTQKKDHSTSSKRVYLTDSDPDYSRSSDEDDYRDLRARLGPTLSRNKRATYIKNGKTYTKRGPKKSKRHRDPDDDDDYSEDSSDEGALLTEYVPKKRKMRSERLKDLHVVSEDEMQASQSQATPSQKGRKNIRSILTEKELKKSTRLAGLEEKERVKRVKAICREGLCKYEVTPEGKRRYTQVWLEKGSGENSNKALVDVNPALLPVLHQHQVEGIQFIYDCTIESVRRARKHPGGGCILAHCMGLGKSLQVVAFLDAVLTSPNLHRHFRTALIIAPASVLRNWSREFAKFLGKRNIAFSVLNMDKYKEVSQRMRALEAWQSKGGVLIIGYSLFRMMVEAAIGPDDKPGPRSKKAKEPKESRYTEEMKDTIHNCLLNPGPDFVICDEGHKLKNDKNCFSKAITKMRTLRRVILTGTPLQNNLEEYFVMASFVKPHLLGTKKEFRNRFINPIENGQQKDAMPRDVSIMQKRAHVLHKQLDGCVQRRDYSYIQQLLPPKQEYVLYIRLGKLQRDLYDKYLDMFCRYYDENEQKFVILESASRTIFEDRLMFYYICLHPISMLRSNGYKEFCKTKSSSNPSITAKAASSSKAGSTKDSPLVLLDDEDLPTTPAASEVTISEGKVSKWFNYVLRELPDIKQYANQAAANNLKLRVDWSPKLIVLSDILKRAALTNEKVLVFSQNLDPLNLIEDMLKLYTVAQKQRWTIGQRTPNGSIAMMDGTEAGNGIWEPGKDYLRFDGTVSTEDRKIQCDMFNAAANRRTRLFLISTKAGSLGINLVAATRVVMMDVCWNPSDDIQSMFRVYRFGQTKPVYIYRLVAQGTMEEKIYNRQVTKQSLSMRVVDESHITRTYTRDEVEGLYSFTPEVWDPTAPRAMPNLPADTLMAELVRSRPEIISSYHEHDSLLQLDEHEIISEEDKRMAWEEYERERSSPPPPPQPQPNVPNQYNPPNHNPGYSTGPSYNPLLAPFGPMAPEYGQPASYNPLANPGRVAHRPAPMQTNINETQSNNAAGAQSAERGRAYLESAKGSLKTWAVTSAGISPEQAETHLNQFINANRLAHLDNFSLAHKLFGTFPGYVTQFLESRPQTRDHTSAIPPVHIID